MRNESNPGGLWRSAGRSGGKNEKIVALDADLAHATMTLEFAKVCPERF